MSDTQLKETFCPSDEHILAKLKSSLKDSISSFWKGKHEQRPRSFQGIDGVLKIYDRVVTFIKDSPARGTVEYIGVEIDSTGTVYIIVGLELGGTYIFGCREPLKSKLTVLTQIIENPVSRIEA